MAGMFGARNGILNKYKKIFYEKSHIKNKFDPITADEKIMSEIFYPIIVSKAFIHDSIYKIESFSIDFPKTNYNGFVGEIINEVKPLGLLEKIFKFRSRIASFISKNYKNIISSEN